MRSRIGRIVMPLAASLAGAILVGGLAFGRVALDPPLPDYKPRQGVSGNIKSVGSDTMNNLMTLWAEGFRKFYPNVQIEIEGKGSSTAPPALIAGTSQFGPMSRAMKSAEIDQFEAKFGYKPTALPTSLDMLAVYVHKDNPIRGLTLPQVAAIFSKTRKGGYSNDIRTWGQVGLTGAWASRPISLYGRNSASGTYGYFKEHALFNGDFKDESRSSRVVFRWSRVWPATGMPSVTAGSVTKPPTFWPSPLRWMQIRRWCRPTRSTPTRVIIHLRGFCTCTSITSPERSLIPCVRSSSGSCSANRDRPRSLKTDISR